MFFYLILFSQSSKVVEKSFFFNFSSNDSGGALSVSTDELNVSYCVFSDCFSKVNGGALFSTAPKNSVVFSCFYGNKCGNLGADVFLEGSSYHFVEESTCIGAIVGYSESIGLRYGAQMIKNVNSSKCSSPCVPTITICSCSSVTLRYYNSVSNHGECGLCAYLYLLKDCHEFGNFVNNTLTVSSMGTLRFHSAAPDMHSFIFLNNQGTISYQLDPKTPGVLYNSLLSCASSNLGAGFSHSEFSCFNIESTTTYNIKLYNTYVCNQDTNIRTFAFKASPAKIVFLMLAKPVLTL